MSLHSPASNNNESVNLPSWVKTAIDWCNRCHPDYFNFDSLVNSDVVYAQANSDIDKFVSQPQANSDIDWGLLHTLTSLFLAHSSNDIDWGIFHAQIKSVIDWYKLHAEASCIINFHQLGQVGQEVWMSVC